MAKTKTKKDTTRLMKLNGGPFDSQKVRLSGDAIRKTADFTASGMIGCYENGRWKQSAAN